MKRSVVVLALFLGLAASPLAQVQGERSAAPFKMSKVLCCQA